MFKVNKILIYIEPILSWYSRTTQSFFQETGTWYNLLKETPLQVSDTNISITLAPGEFKVYGNELVTLSNEDFDDFENDIKLYPNPTSNYFSLNKSVNQIEIYNVTGQLIKRFEGNYEVNHRFNIESLKGGLYFVKANAINSNISVKLLKE